MNNDGQKPGWGKLINMNCAHASRLLGEGHDRALSRRERLFLRLHLVGCGWCRRYGRQLRTIRGLMVAEAADANGDDAVRLSEEARQRIAQRLG